MSLVIVAPLRLARTRLRQRIAAHHLGVPVAPGIPAVPVGVLAFTDRPVGLFTYGVV